KIETVTAKLMPMPDAIPSKLPLPSSAGKALEAQPKGKGLDPAPKLPVPKKGSEPKKAPKEKTSPVLFRDDPFSENKPGKKDKVPTGFIERTDEALGRSYWLYVPDNYDANVSHGLIVWFHPVSKRGKDGEIMARTFR